MRPNRVGLRRCTPHVRRVLSAALLASTLAGVAASSARAVFEPNWKPSLEVPRTAGEIRVDGDLTDPGWRSAARALNFCETSPGDQVEPSVGSEAMITYDDTYLYVALIAHDDPAAVRYSLSDRDAIFRDDYFGLIVDTYGESAWAYEFFVNPLGIQGDLRWTPQGEDINFDLVWHSRGKVTDRGYQVEIAIPFASLRFPDAPEQTWRATFWRDHPRDSRRRYSWAAMNRDDPCWPCNFGTLTGIRDVTPGSSVDVIASVVGNQSSSLEDSGDPDSGLDHGDVDGEASLNLRYAISNSFSAEGSINPDFSQVESDAAQIDVNTTFALFFPERRPFFLDGQDLFDTWINAVYTRSVNDPSGAVKLLGRMGSRDVAYLGAVDETTPVLIPFEDRSAFVGADRSVSNILRVRRKILEDSHVGALVTDRRLQGGGSGTFLSLDGTVRFLENYRVELQVAATHTEEPDDTTATAALNGRTFDGGKRTAAFDGESFWGEGMYFSVERSARVWNFDIDYADYSPTFRADNGFITRNDQREVVAWTGLLFRPNGRLVDHLQPNMRTGWRWNYRGVRKTAWVMAEFPVQLKAQTEIGVNWMYDTERFREVDFDRMFRFGGWVDSRFSREVQLGFWAEAGDYIARNASPDPLLGPGFNAEVWGQLRPFPRLVIEPAYRYSELETPDGGLLFSGYIARTRINYQFTREFFLRLVLQYDSFGDVVNLEPLLTYKVNPFTAVYLGSTHAYQELPNSRTSTTDYTQTERQFFAKLQVLFQR